MFRFLARLVGFLLIAAGFVGLVVDGTRSIANTAVMFMPLGELLFAAFPKTFPLIEPAVTRHIHPFLWNPILLNLFTLPASLLAFGLGVLLLWAGRKPVEPIGYLARR
ncbi:hypothetical protein [Salinarimonas soli]|uniref:Uncharacterized protein n=1 Tax=Salinarimonas soli TaxID=1638099 RepID=A0A5B2W0B7_9HYPH|nr:hypothetical protein [Salinarimonas soli]KAA2244378.1 hypothetical protein F0L46_00315 [Salinarimonas soli]